MSDLAHLTITLLAGSACEELSAAFTAIGWQKPVSQYERHLAEQERRERVVLGGRNTSRSAIKPFLRSRI